jgi:hypothetical protein
LVLRTIIEPIWRKSSVRGSAQNGFLIFAFEGSELLSRSSPKKGLPNPDFPAPLTRIQFSISQEERICPEISVDLFGR